MVGDVVDIVVGDVIDIVVDAVVSTELESGVDVVFSVRLDAGLDAGVAAELSPGEGTVLGVALDTELGVILCAVCEAELDSEVGDEPDAEPLDGLFDSPAVELVCTLDAELCVEVGAHPGLWLESSDRGILLDEVAVAAPVPELSDLT